MHDVVVSAVIAAVAAATITFNSTSQNREFFISSVLQLTVSFLWGINTYTHNIIYYIILIVKLFYLIIYLYILSPH